MLRQVDFGSGVPPAAAASGAPGDSNTNKDGWEPVENKRKVRQQRSLSIQTARRAAQYPRREKMLWREGMILGPGQPMIGGAGARARLTAFRGAGTLAEPRVCWNMDIKNYDQTLIGDCEALVRDEARRLDCTMVVIRGDVHHTTRNHDAKGQTVFLEDLSNPGRGVAQLEQVDDHLTVYMGVNLDDIRLQGHVFVQLEHFGPDPNPPYPKSFREMSARYKNRTLKIKGKMPRGNRQYVQAGHGKWSEEYYEYGNSLSHNKHNIAVLERIRAQYPPVMQIRRALL